MATARTGAKGKASLERSLGLVTATLLTTGMIIGTGIFGAIGAASVKAGSGILLSVVLGGLVALATGLSAAELGINFPEEGGAFIWARKFDQKTLGFIAGSAYLGKGTLSLGVISLAFATYSAQIIPGLSVHLAAFAVIFGIIAVNFFGVKMSTGVVIILMGATVGLLALFVGFSAHAIEAKNLTPVTGNGFLEVLAGAAIFFWTWDGFMRTAIMAGEVKDPQTTIPFAIVGGIAIAALVFVAVAIATLGVLGPQSMGEDDVAPFRAAARAMGHWGSWVILAAAWLATLSEMVGDLLSASRVAYTMGEARELPKWVGAIHPRSKVPRHVALILGLISAGLVLFFNLRVLLTVVSVFSLVWYATTHFAALKLKRAQRLVTPLIPWFGLVSCLALLGSLPVWATGTGLSALAVFAGIRWLVLSRKIRAKHG